jgi:hypothetical protein
MTEPVSLSTYVPGRPVVGPVFHYSSAAGLLGMVSSGTVWASEASSLNDLAEVRQGWEAIRRVLPTLPGGEGRELLESHAEQPLSGRHEVFVFSASTAGDDANQWRLYAEGGRGYVLELDGRVRLAPLSVIPAPERPKDGKGFGGLNVGLLFRNAALVTPWLHVIYEDHEVRAALTELIGLIETEQRELLSSPTEEDYAVGRSLLRDESYSALTTLANLIKSPGFSGENEVRVVTTFFLNGDQVNYRPGSNGIVGYATLTAGPDGYTSGLLRPELDAPVPTRLPLSSVRTGPLLSEEHTNTLRGFLDRHELDGVAISHSTVPLR